MGRFFCNGARLVGSASDLRDFGEERVRGILNNL